MMLLRLRVAFRKEFAQFFRSKVMVILVLYVFAETANCAWALTMDVRNLPLLVVDQDQSGASRALAERFRIAPFFDIRYAQPATDFDLELQRGTAQLVLLIPPGFANALVRGQPAQVQLLADGTYSNFAQAAMGRASEIIGAYNAQVHAESMLRGGDTSPLTAVVNRVRLWYMPGLQYTHTVMISMLGISVLILGVLLPAAAIVREKEDGTLEQLLVTPLRPSEFVAAKLAPMGVILVAGLAFGMVEARLLFGLPLNGSLWLFFGLSLLLFFTTMGLGAYIGAIARNLLQTLLLTFAYLFTMIFLSGTIVPIENMPLVLQWLTYLSPLRYYLPIATGILIKGVGLDVLAPNALALGGYGLLLMAVGVWQLRRTFAG